MSPTLTALSRVLSPPLIRSLSPPRSPLLKLMSPVSTAFRTSLYLHPSKTLSFNLIIRSLPHQISRTSWMPCKFSCHSLTSYYFNGTLRLDTPFELVKKDINDTFLGLYFDANVLPVPAQDTVTFCNNLDTSVVDDLGLDLIRIVKIGIIILIIIALVLVGLNCILTWYRWRSLKRHLEFTRQAWTTDPAIAYLEAPPQEWKTEPTITHSQLFAPSRPWTTDVTPSATPRALTTDLTPSGTPRAYTTDLTPLPSPQALMTPTITHPQPLASPQALTTDHTITQSQPPVSAPQVTLSDHNLMMLGANSEHPLITRIMHQLAAKLNLTPRQHVHTRWFLNYIFYAPARVCFLIGFFGLLSVEIQLFAMNPLAAKYRTRAQATVSDFSDLIATSINASMYNQSSFYAGQVNSRVDTVQDTINNGLFGWVNGTTTTLNNTINEFYTDVQNAVTLIFGNTILEEPAQEFIKCFIGGKVDAIENAITFMHNNLQVDMPRVNESVLVLSQSSVNEATAPIAAAAVGNGSNGSEGFLGQVIQDYVATLKKERLMFAIYMGIWGVVCLMGLVILLRHSFGNPNTKEKVEEEDLPSDKEKEPVDDAPPPSKREFKPSWLKKPKPRTCNLLAVIRDAFGRIPRLKLPKMEVELPTPDVGAWYDKTRGLLKREDKQETEQPLKLDIPRRDSSTQSRFSISPATTPSWKNLLPPLKKPSMPSVVVTPPQSPKRRETRDDVVSLRLSVQSTTPLIPLRPNGDYQLTPPKRWKGAAAQSQSTTSSSKLVKFQLPLAAPQPSLLSQYSRSPTPRLLPKTPGKSAPLGSRMSDPTQWRVTNDIPEEPSRNSAESLSKIPDNNFPVITMSRVDVRNSALNPFITPFDDECRVRIEEPSLEGLRKSVHTGS